MHKYLSIILLVVISVFTCLISYADETDELIQNRLSEYQGVQTTGAQLAQEFSTVTGFAINPLAGICAIGAYTYFTTPEDRRDSLPWYASSAFLTIMSSILVLIILKDSSKVVVPKVLSTPLDAIEGLAEKPVTPFIAMAILISETKNGFISEAQNIAASFLCSDAFANNVVSQHLAATTTSTDYLSIAISTIAILIVFMIVWVVNQAFNFMVFLCPSGLVDLFLISIKNLIFATIIGLSVVSPYIGAVLSAVILLICFILFSFAFRMTVFGYVTTFDFVFFKRLKMIHPKVSSTERVIGFAGKGMKSIPRLSMGYIEKNQMQLSFTYRPGLILGKKKVALINKGEKFQLVKGLMTLGIDKLINKGGEVKEMNLVQLPLRYQGVESDVASFLGTDIITDSKITKGIKGTIAWICTLFSKSATPH